MGRAPRITTPGLAYHVLNRRAMRLALFAKDADNVAFGHVPGEGLELTLRPRGRPRKEPDHSS